MNDVKQIIVMRKYFIDANGNQMQMRRGKQIAQACHASIAFITNKLYSERRISPNHTESCLQLTDEEQFWIADNFTKICVYVNSEQELIDLYDKSIQNGLTAHLITDDGLTEFKGIHTKTTLAIGPHEVAKFIGVTDNLPLL